MNDPLEMTTSPCWYTGRKKRTVHGVWLPYFHRCDQNSAQIILSQSRQGRRGRMEGRRPLSLRLP
jgi:hypothetical protein